MQLHVTSSVLRLVIIIGLSAPLAAGAQTASSVMTAGDSHMTEVKTNFQGVQQSTSDGVLHQMWAGEVRSQAKLPISNYGRFDYGLQFEKHSGESPSGGYSGKKLFASIGKGSPESLRVDASGGIHALTATAETPDKSISFMDVSLLRNFPLNTTLRLQAGQDFVYQSWIAAGPIDEALSQRGGSIGIDSYPAEAVHVLLNTTYQLLSDDNVMQVHDGSVLYGISPQWPWIWAGVGCQVFRFNEPRGEYWSPRRQANVGPRFEVALPLKGALTAHGSLQVNRSQDVDGPLDVTDYYQVGLNFKNETWNISADYVGMGEVPPYGSWSRKDWTLSVSSVF